MRREEIRELRLMEEISKEGGLTTQRELAKRLHISLGSVNSFIKRIVRKGYFETSAVPGRRARYFLTPRGLAEKSRLTVDYIRYALSFHREIRQRLRRLARDLRKAGVEKVALVGTEELAELFCLSMLEEEIEITLVLSEDGAGKRFLGHRVEALAALRECSWDVVCVMDLERMERILAKLEKSRVPRDRVVVCPDI